MITKKDLTSEKAIVRDFTFHDWQHLENLPSAQRALYRQSRNKMFRLLRAGGRKSVAIEVQGIFWKC
ncbi:MAG: hypothetical protein HFH80_02630 [Lachnospiraceae bacterium]|nr:hypothetical protein [Lachnospiraceae bacterium]